MLAPVLLLVPLRVLSLAEALHTAEVNQPKLRQARATTEAARARVDVMHAPLLPQVSGSASYSLSTANYAPRPGALPSSVATTASAGSFDGRNYFSFGLSASQLVYDFGQTWGKGKAAEATVEAQAASEKESWRQIAAQVRTAYFAARAQKALVDVARETLANQERHLMQVEGYVRVGSRPEIDLAQVRADRANARVQVITAEGNLAAGLAALQQTMGVDAPVDFVVSDEMLGEVEGEGAEGDGPLGEAIAARPDLLVLDRQIRSQELLIGAQKGAYGPSLSLGAGLTEAGQQIDNMAWNLSLSASLQYSLFQGMLVPAQLREQRATLASLHAQLDAIKLQVRLELEQARVGVRSARESLAAADEALVNARQRLRLAEGRYAAGVGNMIELGDSQLAVTSAAGQKVQAEYNLSAARAALLRALGRP